MIFAPTFTAWQKAARRALAHDLEPAAIHWHELDDAQPTLGMFDESDDDRAPAKPTPFRVPRAFLEIARHTFNLPVLAGDGFDAIARLVDQVCVSRVSYASFDQVIPEIERLWLEAS